MAGQKGQGRGDLNVLCEPLQVNIARTGVTAAIPTGGASGQSARVVGFCHPGDNHLDVKLRISLIESVRSISRTQPVARVPALPTPPERRCT